MRKGLDPLVTVKVKSDVTFLGLPRIWLLVGCVRGTPQRDGLVLHNNLLKAASLHSAVRPAIAKFGAECEQQAKWLTVGLHSTCLDDCTKDNNQRYQHKGNLVHMCRVVCVVQALFEGKKKHQWSRCWTCM